VFFSKLPVTSSAVAEADSHSRGVHPRFVTDSTPCDPPSGARMRLAQRLAVFVLACYKTFLSPVLPSACKFYPSCSMYAKEAVERHGVIRGMSLAARRLWRCRPFSPGGYDPVPDA